MTWRICLIDVSLKSENFSLIAGDVSDMQNKNVRRAYFAPSPCKIELRFDVESSTWFDNFYLRNQPC